MDKNIERLSKMETGVITDSLKLLGYEGWMSGILPLDPDARICGRAFTMKYTFEQDPEAHGENYYLLLDQIKEGDVIFITGCDYPSTLLGENMAHAAKRMGAAGIIVDGTSRDTAVIRKMDFPVFAKGAAIRSTVSNMKISEYQVTVPFGGATVHPGDYVIGDADGVIVIPSHVIEDVLYQAERLVEIETQMEEAISSGKSMQECVKIVSQKKFKRE